MGANPSKPAITTTPPPLNEKRAYSDNLQQPPIDCAASSSASVEIAAVTKWSTELEKDATFQLARLVLTHSDPVSSLLSRDAAIADEKVFNVDLKGAVDGKYPGPVVNQKSSGRCWLFATTNVLRYNVVEQLKLGDFELSQSYLFFYDKLEKANYFLENMLDLTDETLDSRLVSFLNEAPVNDGGQWDMAFNLLEKYGAIPQALFPESFSSSASAKLGRLLTSKLREYALMLRGAAATGGSLDQLRKIKSGFMAEVYSTLCITLGTAPKPDEPFTWDYYDKAGKFHTWTGTPLEFYAAYARRKGMDPKDSFSLINDPRNDYGKLYTVKRLGNIWGARGVRYVNAPTSVLEDAVVAGIRANTPLFFGCDVGKSSDSARGIMDTRLFDLQAAYGYTLGMDKAQRLLTGDSSMTHAMVITAVHLDTNGRPVRYKVENSWSDTAGDKGWFMMSAEWFREYVYQVVVPRSIVDSKWSEVLDKGEAVELEAWDPMGALA